MSRYPGLGCAGLFGLMAFCLLAGAVETDANGIWFFNWVTDGGDLRVAHFFGMHAMQAIPLFAVLLPARIGYNVRYVLIGVFSTAYAAFCGFTFYQALQGQPFIS